MDFDDDINNTYSNIKKLLRRTGQSKRADEITEKQLAELEAKKLRKLKLSQDELASGRYGSQERSDYLAEQAINIGKRKKQIREEK